ncbi:MAG: oligosaccharide flippase family protein [Candidatus Yonathbacteria bacterium]|nr:oligosaccharide flippase family protein [Candidatus Yonathbacteria bacterium]
MKKTLQSVWNDTLFRNSFYPMLATIVMGISGFIFWFLATRLFSPADIGIATTLIAVMNMIGFLSPLGFDSVFIRFLPHTTKKHDTINTGLVVATAAAGILAILFVIFAKEISPALSFVQTNTFISIAFIIFCITTGLNALTDSIFLAYRATKYTFFINTAFTLFRLGLLFLFIKEGTLGIFLAVALSQAIGLVLSITVLLRTFDYKPTCHLNTNIVKQVRSYLTGNYLAGILNLLPTAVVPIMVINGLGPEQTAFYSIGIMIGNLLYAIPWTTTRALFAEGSHDPDSLISNARKSFAAMCAILFPAIIILILAGDTFLTFFGKTYSDEGFLFLQIIAITGVAVYTLSLLETFFRVTKKPHWLIVVNTVYAGTIIFLCQALMSYGLVGIGIAWLSGYVAATIVSFLIWRNMK